MKGLINSPKAKIIIWNYKNKLSIDTINDLEKVNAVEKIDVSNYVIDFHTTKSKSGVGQFQMRLTPSYNWQGILTVGSWICLMASNKEDISDKFVSPKSFIMIGKISDIRYSMQILENGARASMYYINGEDWSSVFETKVYFDPLLMPQVIEKLSGPAQQLLVLMNTLTDIYKQKSIPTTSDLFKGILHLFSSQLYSIAETIENKINIELCAGGQLLIPSSVLEFLNLPASPNNINFLLGDTGVKLFEGKLTEKGVYNNEDPTCTLLDVSSLFGTNSIMGIFQNVGNCIINEIFSDAYFDEKGYFNFALFKRIKPFCLRDVNNKVIEPFVSKFDLLPHTYIPEYNIISFSAGVNNKDRYNFIEVMPSQQYTGVPGYANAVKAKSQITETASVARDGFKPMIIGTKHVMLTNDKLELSIEKLVGWKDLLKEWYFNSHGILNGNITFIGVDNYIGVGQNILFPAKVLGGKLSKEQKDDSMILAHVESVQHSFTLENHARTFITSVNFVRGVLADKDGKILLKHGTTFDQNFDELHHYKNYNTIDTLNIRK